MQGLEKDMGHMQVCICMHLRHGRNNSVKSCECKGWTIGEGDENHVSECSK